MTRYSVRYSNPRYYRSGSSLDVCQLRTVGKYHPNSTFFQYLHTRLQLSLSIADCLSFNPHWTSRKPHRYTRKLSRSKHTRNCHTLPRQISKEYPVIFIQLYRVKDGIGNLCGHCLVGVTTCVRTLFSSDDINHASLNLMNGRHLYLPCAGRVKLSATRIASLFKQSGLTSTGGPRAPGVPNLPRRPAGPGALAPCSPWGLKSPLEPTAPGTSSFPLTPGGPMFPWGPGGPRGPGRPGGPLGSACSADPSPPW